MVGMKSDLRPPSLRGIKTFAIIIISFLGLNLKPKAAFIIWSWENDGILVNEICRSLMLLPEVFCMCKFKDDLCIMFVSLRD